METPWSPAENGERLARQLCRLLARGRFSSMAIILRDRRRVPIRHRNEIRVRRARSTIEVATRGGVHEILFEDLLAVELKPRVRPTEPEM